MLSEHSALPIRNARRGDLPAPPASVARVYYRMLTQLGRARGVTRVSEIVLRHAAMVVEARLGACAVTPPAAAQAAIVATFGYPRALVEHVRIDPGVGVIGHVIASGRPMLSEGAALSQPRRLRYHTDSYVAVPIASGEHVFGALCVTDRQRDEAFTRQDVAVLRMFAASAAMALERERALDSAEVYAHAAAIDPVTGLFNRRYLEVRLQEELQRSRRHELPMALLLIDLDDFKQVNDSYGHLAGDMVLRDVADILRRSVRLFDVCARYGGEEFVIVMPGSSDDSAMRIAERIRERIEAYRPVDRVLSHLRVTVSVGLAVSTPGGTVPDLVERADQALYTAKRTGKNRIETDPG